MSLKLTHFEVRDLLGQGDHTVPFPKDWSFVILHGPNGIGKTKMLELLTAALQGRFDVLLQLPFSRAELRFDDGSNLLLARIGQLGLFDEDEDASGESKLQVILSRDGKHTIWDTSDSQLVPSANVTRFLDRETHLRRTGAGRWHDLRYGDVITTREAAERYADMLPAAALRQLEPEMPTELVDFVHDANVHLIETQRLLAYESASISDRDNSRRLREGRPRRSTVVEFSEDLTRRLREVLARNSRTSQELDRSFPRRLLDEAPLPESVTDDVIRQRYDEQSNLRDGLSQIAVLDTSAADLPLPDRALEPWERRVLWTYLEDSQRKLATFQRLYDRLTLLRSIINSRFLGKTLQIDAERGFTFVTSSRRTIGPNQLSSGEQHELILAYDLLFNVKEGTLVLIDEPEISLHVAWQQAFLTDIASIGEVADLRFVVATHSPQVIHKSWAFTVPLTLGSGEAIEGDASRGVPRNA